MALTRREQAEYDRLRAKRRTDRTVTDGARRRPRADQDDDDHDGIFVLTGRRADGFLDRMFGPSSTAEPDDDDDDQDDDDQDDDDDDDDDGPEPDPGSSAAEHRYFSGRRGRG